VIEEKRSEREREREREREVEWVFSERDYLGLKGLEGVGGRLG